MSKSKDDIKQDFQELVNIIKTLRGPNGCPWDKKQTPKDVRTYLLEEVYEVIEAIDEKDSNKLKEELGDVLLLIIFLSDYYQKEGEFSLSDVLKGISNKLVKRHPHVFGSANLKTPDEIIKNWDRLKQEEKKNKRKDFFASIPKSAPALLRSYLFLKKAYRFHKIKSPDLKRITEEIRDKLDDIDKKEEVIGELLFAIVKLSSVLEIDPESALLNFLENYSNQVLTNER